VFAPNCRSLASVAAAGRSRWLRRRDGRLLSDRRPTRGPRGPRRRSVGQCRPRAGDAGSTSRHKEDRRYLHIAAGEVIKRGAGQAGISGVTRGRLQVQFARLRFFDARDEWTRRWWSAHQCRPFRGRRRRARWLRARSVPRQEHLAGASTPITCGSRAGRIGQRAAQVENGCGSPARAERA